MGIIRSQSIQSSVITYIGFAIGAVNTLLFTKYIPADIYGLTRLIQSTALIFLSLSAMGSTTLFNKFYPYYRAYLPQDRRDLFGIVIIVSSCGFVLLTTGTIIFRELLVQKYSANSPLFVAYFHLLYPATFFLLIFTLFEHFSNNHYKSIFPIFLKETMFRLLTTAGIVLFIFHVFGQVEFLWYYALLYMVLAAALLIYLKKQHALSFSFRTSHVTRRLAGKLISFNSLVFGGSVFMVLSQNIDALVVSSTMGLASNGVLEFNTYISNVIAVPQRSVIAIAIPVLAQAWKEKDLHAIQRIYTRSSLTMLIFSILIFMLIWLNYDAAFKILNLPPLYSTGRYVVLLLGMSKIVELGTGVNQQILGTSNMWRFEFISSIILVALNIPLAIWMVKLYGVTGSAAAGLISIFVYNSIRFYFLYRRYKMQPFTKYTLYVILLALTGWASCHYLINPANPYLQVMLRTTVFIGIFIAPILIFGWSQDVTESYRKGMALVNKYLKRS